MSETNKRNSFKGLFASLGILAILGSAFGGYLYFKDNLGLGNDKVGKTALAANVPVSSTFNPSDCNTYLSNNGARNGDYCGTKLYEKGGILYKSLDIAPGELVNVRDYYNNATTDPVNSSTIQDTLPAGFTRVGSITNNYVDATPVTLSNTLFNGSNLNVGSAAGYFGNPNNANSTILDMGKKRYLQFVACNPGPAGPNNFDSPAFLSAVDSQQAFTNADCVNAMGTSTAIKSKDFFVDTLGQKYAQFVACNPDPSGITYPNFDSTAYFGVGNSYATITDADCKAGLGQPSNGPAIKSKDFRVTILGNRYLQFLACNPNPSGPNPFDAPAAMIATNTIQTFTNADCVAGLGQSTAIVSKNFQPDLSSTTRGYGYISYTIQTPTTGLTNGQQFGTVGVINIGQVGLPTTTTNSLTIINANSANIISGIIPNDCSTYPGGTVSSETNGDGTACTAKTYVKNGIEYNSMEVAPGESVTVRLRYNNSATTSADQIRLKDNIPAGWTLSGNATAKYVDSTPVGLGTATSIFNSPDDTGLDVAPHVGFFGASLSTTAGDVVSSLELGKKRYLGATFCSSVGPLNTTVALTGPANTPPTPSCVNVLPNDSGNFYGTSSYDLLGNRYLPASWCSSVPQGPAGGLGFSLGAPRNDQAGASCFNVGTNTFFATYYDLLGKSIIPYFVCQQFSPISTNYTYVATPANTNSSANCQSIYRDSNANVVTNLNLLDTNRAHGYLEYQMTSPSNLSTGTVAGNPSVILEDSNDNNWSNTNNPTASATLIGVTTPAPNINYTKLYSVDGGTTWSTNVSASTGQPIKVRLWNENTGGLSVTNGNIKDTLPNGFNYTAGSTKNCLNPSTILPTTPDNTELVCDIGTSTNKDTLFNTLTSTSGVSPSAGLYDASSTSTTVASGGTAYNAVAGAKEIGKKRYAQLQSDAQSSVGLSDLTCNLIADNASAFTNVGFCSNRDQRTVSMKVDLLGKRYAQLQSDAQSSVGLSDLTCNLTADNASTFTNVGFCSNRDQRTVSMKVDLLDASRSKSYIEYEMSASSSVVTGTYGAISNINSTATTPEFTSINSGTNSDITITADPAFSVKKLLALPTSGTGSTAVCPTDTSSYTPTLSGVDAGATVCVRLAYQNKTSGAISNTLISDSQIVISPLN